MLFSETHANHLFDLDISLIKSYFKQTSWTVLDHRNFFETNILENHSTPFHNTTGNHKSITNEMLDIRQPNKSRKGISLLVERWTLGLINIYNLYIDVRGPQSLLWCNSKQKKNEKQQNFGYPLADLKCKEFGYMLLKTKLNAGWKQPWTPGLNVVEWQQPKIKRTMIW